MLFIQNFLNSFVHNLSFPQEVLGCGSPVETSKRLRFEAPTEPAGETHPNKFLPFGSTNGLLAKDSADYILRFVLLLKQIFYCVYPIENFASFE